MAAVTAATVAVAATAAATAYSASQAGKGGGSDGPSFSAPGVAERAGNRVTQDILDEERAVLEDALMQGANIQPEMYRALGLEPIYDREEGPEDAEVAQLSQQSEALADQLNVLQIEKANINSQRGKGLRGRQKRLNKIKREIKAIRKTEAAVNDALGRKSTVPRRIIGFNKISGPADPTGSTGNAFGGALDSMNQHLANALSGKEPIDPTLKTAFDEKERSLRERLRRQMGTDYETTTAGAEALANFDRERSEAFSQYNREVISQYSQLSENRAAALSNLTGQRLNQLAYPSTFRVSQGLALGQAAKDRMSPAELRQRERALRRSGGDSSSSSSNADAIAAILGGVGSAAGTAGTYAGGLSGSLAGTAGASAGDTNVPVGGEFDTAGLLGRGGRIGAGGYLTRG